MNRSNSFIIEAEAEDGIKVAQKWAEKELEMKVQNNPDVIILRHGLFSVDDARRVLETAASAPVIGEYKVIIITASRAYHEAQNALLKLFEEPPTNTYLFFILPTLGGLLPTLRSRVQILNTSLDIGSPTSDVGLPMSYVPKETEEFLKANKEKRSAIIKKLANGKDEDERRSNRDEAIAILNGIEAIVYQRRGDTKQRGDTLWSPQGVTSLLNDIAILRGHLNDRSAPVRMILEHLSLVIPGNLL